MKKFKQVHKKSKNKKTPLLYVNQHGSHAKPVKVYVNQHGSHAKPVKESTQEDNPLFDIGYRNLKVRATHDGTPEGKAIAEQLREYHNHETGFARFLDNPYGTNPYHADKNADAIKHFHETHGHRELTPGKNMDDHAYKYHQSVLLSHDHEFLKHTPELGKVLNGYTRSSVEINRYLDNGMTYTSKFIDPNEKSADEKEYHENIRKDIRHLDHIIGHGATNHISYPDIVTFHGANLMKRHFDSNNLLKSRGYISSSTSPYEARGFGRHIIAIHGPKGYKAYPISESYSSHPDEKEVLHPRGMILRRKASISSFEKPNHFSKDTPIRVTLHHMQIEDFKPEKI